MSGGDSAEVLEPADHARDPVAVSVGDAPRFIGAIAATSFGESGSRTNGGAALSGLTGPAAGAVRAAAAREPQRRRTRAISTFTAAIAA